MADVLEDVVFALKKVAAMKNRGHITFVFLRICFVIESIELISNASSYFRTIAFIDTNSTRYNKIKLGS